MAPQLLPTSNEMHRVWSVAGAAKLALPAAEIAAALRAAFDVEFALLDAEGQTLLVPAYLADAAGQWAPLARVAGGRAAAEIIVDENDVLVLAIPFVDERMTVIAVAPFLERIQQDPPRAAAQVAQSLVTSERAATEWLQGQSLWNAEQLLRTAGTVRRQIAAESLAYELRGEVATLSHHVARAFEEITLVYRITSKLKLTQRDDELCRLALDWLAEAVPAQSLAVMLLPIAEAEAGAANVRLTYELYSAGDHLLDPERFRQLVDALLAQGGATPVVLNDRHTSQEGWAFREIRQLVLAPLGEGPLCFGYLAAINHISDGEFGTIEASLLSSVATILGIHSGNKELYRQQEELLASTVRALTSAIDAKDPYTCGHSDRVAQVSVRLAQELGFSDGELQTIYLAGLLHDIGKIGIDDDVLRKPGKLTAAEFDHIKTHVTIGHRILADIRQLGVLLPAVLYHHEQWNGTGYPHGLTGENIPLIARVIAVADAFDAMSSDRPYRPGMPAEKLDEVFRAGAGKQWDAQVVAAFFAARADIQAICDSECRIEPGVAPQWT